jgi:hypothetical protein
LGKQGLGFNLPNVLADLSSSSGPDGTPHSDTAGSFNPTTATSGATRPVTIVSELTPEEKTIFDERLKQVVSTGIVSDVNQLAFTFRATDSAKIPSTSQIYLTASRGVNNNANPVLNTDQSYWSKIDGKLAYTCASMVELLLCLGSSGSGLYVKGSLGVTNGFTGAAQGDMSDQGGVSDHTFGRAFDINMVGRSSGDAVSLSGKNIDVYRTALNMLLAKLKTIPEYLHPDLIIIHDQLVTEYGIGNGFEGDFTGTNAALIIKSYPELVRINFSGDAGHRDHIHMSFGPARAGSYENWTNSDTGSSNEGNPGGGDAPSGNAGDISELGKSFATTGVALKNKNALYKALIEYGGYSAEAAAIWMCVAERESNFSPGSFNGQVNDNSGTPKGTQDYSIGLWQVNFLGIPSLLTSELVLASLDSANKLVKENGRGYKLIDKNWQANGTKDQATAIAKMKQWYKVNPKKPDGYGISEGKSHSDSRLWNAITQIFLLSRLTSNKKDSWMWWNWGEYSGGPASGWLAKLKFQTAVNYYLANNTGKTAEDLKSWVKRKGTDKNLPSSKTYLDRWLEGYVFNINGSIKETPKNTSATVPNFSRTQIKEAAIWLRINRMDPWEKRNRSPFGCEGFASRLSAGIGLFGAVKRDLFTEEWTGAQRPSSNLTSHDSAQSHYVAIKDAQYFNGPTTELGKNPPAGYLVFWTGGTGANSNQGHIGISLGDGTFIDQNDTRNTISKTISTPQPISGVRWPGSAYTYVGSSSAW